VTGCWRKLHTEALTSQKEDKDVAGMREIRNWVGESEGKRLVSRPKRRWEDTIKMDLNEIGR
jgi:hypothetical protein